MNWQQSIQAAITEGDFLKAREIHAWATRNAPSSATTTRRLSDWAVMLSPHWQQTHTGLRVRLRQPNEGDASFMMGCFQDDEFMAQFHPTAPRQRSEAAIRKALTHLSSSLPRFKAQHWLVERLPDDATSLCNLTESIGLVSVVDLIVTHRRAELLVGLPAHSHRGTGLATEATLLALEVCFNLVGLNKLTSLVLADNLHSQRSTLALGFEQEGYRKAHFRLPTSDKYVDCFENGLTVTAFRGNLRLPRLSQRLLGRNILLDAPA